jgi:hypothetical protein
MAAETLPVLLDERDAYTHYRIKHSTFWSLIAKGELAAVRFGKRTFVTRESIDALINRHRVNPAA